MNDLNSRLLFCGMLLSVALLMPNTVYGIDPITEIKMLTSEHLLNHVNNTAIINQIEHAISTQKHNIEKLNATYQYGNMTIPAVTLPVNMTSQICTPAIDGSHNMTITCVNGGNDTQ